MSAEDFTYQRILSGQPDFPFEIKPDSLFPEAGIQAAVSYTKGCYAGQEVMERVDALGRLPAKIVNYKVNANLSASLEDLDLVNAEGQTAGSVLNYVNREEQSFCFVKVKQKFWEQELFIKSSDSDSLALEKLGK